MSTLLSRLDAIQSRHAALITCAEGALADGNLEAFWSYVPYINSLFHSFQKTLGAKLRSASLTASET